MSAISWTNDKAETHQRRSMVRRIVAGPALILALCAGSSGLLVAALLLSSIYQF